MLSMLRSRVTYTNVALTLALVFAMTGGAYAAKKYLIKSTSQIKPSVLAQLKGKAGPAGSPGAQGPAGAAGKDGVNGKDGLAGTNGKDGKEGKEGKEGSPWTAGGTLPSGKTEMGQWAVSANATAANQKLTSPISFDIPLEHGVAAHYIMENESTPAGCTGSVAAPGAEAGNLCVFAQHEQNATIWVLHFGPVEIPIRFVDGQSTASEETGSTGVVLLVGSTGTGEVEAKGSWAVTAP